MKKFYSALVAATIMIATSAAHAGLITQTNTLNLNVNMVGNSGPASTHSYSHLLSNFTNFNPLVDNLDSATLVLSFGGSGQTVKVVMQGAIRYSGASSSPVQLSTTAALPASFDLSQFLTAEALGVTVSKTQGGGASTVTQISSALTLAWLTSTANDGGNGGDIGGDPTSVPEPGAITLMAIGLLGLAARRRSRKNKSAIV